MSPLDKIRIKSLLTLFDQQEELASILLELERNRRKGVTVPHELMLSHNVNLIHAVQDQFADFCAEVTKSN